MFESLERNFSLIIAFILPGFLFLFGAVCLATYSSADLLSQLRPIRQIGGFLFFLLAATACGMILSAIRWAILDTLHDLTGLRSPKLDFSKLEGRSASFMLVVENNYRYDPLFSQMIFESDGRGQQAHYQVDPRNGNLLTMTRVIGSDMPALAPFELSLGANVSNALYAELNGDQRQDLAYLRDGSVFVALGSSTGFSTAIKISGTDTISDLTMIDSNKDGKFEIYATSTNLNSVLRWAHSSGGFGTPSSLSVAMSPRRITASDIDGDQDTDLIVLSDFGGGQNPSGNLTVSVFQNNGQGLYTLASSPVLKTGLDNAIGIEVLDLDLDGKQDIAAQYVEPVGLGQTAGRINILWGNGSTNFVAGTSADRTVFSGTEIRARDVDNDGDVDVLGDGVYLEAKSGQKLIVKEIDATPSYYTTADVKLRDMVFADLNGDGRKDRVATFDGVFNQLTQKHSDGRVEI